MQTLWQDIKFGARMLRRNPGFTTVAVLTLALGIGANTAIFSIVNTVLLKPLPFEEPDRLVYVWESNPSRGWPRFSVSPPNFMDWREQNLSFENLAAYNRGTRVLTGSGDAERVPSASVSSGFFQTMRTPMEMGRGFEPREEVTGSHLVTVLSYGFWQDRMGGSEDALGKTLVLNGEPHTVIGVASKTFAFPSGVRLWVPLAFDPANPPGRGAHYLVVVGRLKAGTQLSQAQSEMESIAAGLAEAYPNHAGWTVRLVDMKENVVERVRPALLVLLGAVGFVLLIACVNVANLLLARGASREKEIALRLALGAGRGRLVRQLLSESVVLSAAGGAAGTLLGFWLLKTLMALAPSGLPRASEIGIDSRVLLFTLGLSLLTGLLFGLAPALAGTKPNLIKELKVGGGGYSGTSRHRLQNLLVLSEVALSLVLLIGGGLLARSLFGLLQTDPGLDPTNVLTLRISPPRAAYPGDPEERTFYTQLLERVRALPGVEEAGVIHVLPLGGSDWTHSFEIEGSPQMPESKLPSSNFYNVSPGYFHALRIPLLQGRHLSEEDTAQTPRVAVINETFARRYFPDENPVGQRVRIGNGIPEMREIVGIVGDVHNNSLAQPAPAQIYEPLKQNPYLGQTLVVRAAVEPTLLVKPIREVVRAIDPNIPLYSVSTMEQVAANSMAAERFRAMLLGSLAALSLLLASVGLYGVISYAVSRRTHEIGVRVALGATRAKILGMVVGQGMFITSMGIVLGLLGAFGLTRLLQRFLFGISPTDPATFAGVSLILLFVALLACWIPARRATKVDPMVALRYE